MSKEIQYSRISTKLQNLKSAHPQDVSAKLWKETFKGLINGGEAMRLFELFSGTLMLLKARNDRYLTWSDKANSDNWTAKWLENIFEKYDILSKYGPTTVDGKMVHPRKPKVSVTVIETAPVVEIEHEEHLPAAPAWAQLPVEPSQLTDEELALHIQEFGAVFNVLQQEKAHREAKKAKRAELLSMFSEMAKDEGFSLEDILGVI